MQLSNFLLMGGYATYVWSAYGISLVVLFLNFYLAIKKEEKIKCILNKRLQHYKNDNNAT